MQLQFNWLAVFVAATLGMIIPAIWYAPKLFGATWMQLSGLTDEDLKGQGGAYAMGALCSIATSFAIAGFLNFTGSQTFMQGFLAGFQFWAGFTLTQMLMDYRFAKRSWKLTFINVGHSALTMGLTGGILAAWK